MFRKIGDALRRFFSGRYGTDPLNRFLLYVALGCLLLGWLGGKYLATWMSVFNVLAYVPLIWCIVRMYSRNVEARRRENARWIGFCNRVKDRDNRYFKCPRCRQMVRVPRGKGTINIRCPKCGERFLKKT